jgi:peptide/nickel transport system ATP-binding protein
LSQVQLNKVEEEDTTPGWAPLITISNLRAYFKQTKGAFRRRISDIKAVDDVTFDVRKSEVLSLVGESGSGKTTIARCVAALQKPTSGSIKFNGIEVTKLKGRDLTNYRRDVQIIFQDPFESLYSRFDVFTTISTPIVELTGVKDQTKLKEMVTSLLQEVGLNPSDYMYRLPHQLSGGERQRISIARALAPSPKLLVADEPITMLDASQRLNALSVLMQLKEKRNLTVLLITHDLASAQLVSNRTAVLYRGKLVELGPTSTILSRPQHPYTELILQATPDVEGEIPSFGNLGGIEESEVVKKGCVFRPRCKYATQVCSDIDPELIAKTPGRLVACHNALNQSTT